MNPPPSQKVWYGFYEEPEVALEINSEIGQNGKWQIKNLPKITNIIVCVFSRFFLSFLDL
jgi:hypothetical protein